MGEVQQRVQQVQRRLNLNRFFAALGLGLLIATIAWMLVVVADRLFLLELPLVQLIWGAAALALVIAGTLTYVRRASMHAAAVAIDQAAGLKARVSSALAFSGTSEPFAQATCSDAVKVVRGVHVPTHVPLQAPHSWPWTVGMITTAALLYGILPQFNLLAQAESESLENITRRAAEKKQIEVAVKETQQRLADTLKDNPSLKNLVGDLKDLEMSDEPDMTPDELRRDVVKKVESVSNQLRNKLDSSEMKMLEALKRDLAKLETPDGKDNASKLAQALQQGDMKQAKAAMGDLKKQLEDAAANKQISKEQKMQLEAMRKKLDGLSDQMKKLADNKRMQKELENKAGLTPEQAKKLLDQVKNMDPKDLQKALQKALSEQGIQMDQQQLQQMAQKLAQNQQLQEQMKQMAQAMQQAAQQAQQAQQQQGGEGQEGQPQGEGGQQGMGGAMDMMSDLEMAEQMMNDMEAQLAELEGLKDGIGQGMGGGNPGERKDMPPSDQIGGQGPQAGLGYGASTGKKTAGFGYKNQKARGKVKGGEIIGQMLVDGPQLKGEVSAEARDAIAAAQRDATEAIDRKEIPRQYWKVVREFTESMAGLSPPAEAPATPADDSE